MKIQASVYRVALWVLLALIPVITTAQTTAPVSPQQPAASATVNNLQLVIEGKVINVHDGDTVTVLDQDNKKFNIRLQGIDAPELKQEFGASSQQNLSRLVLGKQVTIVWTKMDKYRRRVGTIMLDGRDVNIEQVKAGLAWHFKKYEDEQAPEDRRTYSAAEQSAKIAELGLWKQKPPTAPGDWRQAVKAKRWGPPPPPGTIVGNSNSKRYHRPDCAGYRDMAERNRVFFKTVAEAEEAGYKRAGNCPPEDQVVAAHPVPPRATIQPIPTDIPSITVPVMPQITAPAIPQKAPPAATVTVPESAKVSVATTAETPTATTPRPGLYAPTTIVQGAQEPVIGNKNSKIYHLPGCPGYKRVAEQNQVKFNTAAEAEAAGYVLAKNCSTESKPEPAEPKAVTPLAPDVKAIEPASPVVVPVSPVVINRKVVGNYSSRAYHFDNCPPPTEVAEDNRIVFPSAAVAEALGFKLAAHCRETAQPVEPKSAPLAAPVPDTPPADATPVITSTTATAASAPEGKVIGNKNSQIYHLPSCAGYTKVSEKNRVYFETEQEAEKAGYRKAKNCP